MHTGKCGRHSALMKQGKPGSGMFRGIARRSIPVIFCCMAGFFGLSTAQGVEVNYDEQVDGNLVAFGALPIMLFDLGINTVSGTLGHTDPGPTDYDSFAFSIPAGAVLGAASVTMTDVQGNVSSSRWAFRAGSNTYVTGTLLEEVIPLSPGDADFTSIPHGSDTYNVSHISFGFIGGNTNNTANYEFTFRVSEIPEPASGAIAVLGALGLGWVRWRKKC